MLGGTPALSLLLYYLGSMYTIYVPRVWYLVERNVSLVLKICHIFQQQPINITSLIFCQVDSCFSEATYLLVTCAHMQPYSLHSNGE